MHGQLIQTPKVSQLADGKLMMQLQVLFLFSGVALDYDSLVIPSNGDFHAPFWNNAAVNGLQFDFDVASYIGTYQFGNCKSIGYDISMSTLTGAGGTPLFIWNRSTNAMLSLVANSSLYISGILPIQTETNPKFTFFKQFDGAIPVVKKFIAQASFCIYNFDAGNYHIE